MEKIIEKIITCPHCNDILIISELNWKIFRHGIYKKSNEQIDTHLSKEKCDILIKKDLIYGCGKPLQIIIQDDGTWIVQKCDYIWKLYKVFQWISIFLNIIHIYIYNKKWILKNIC